jgi:hypothetical protein
MPTTPSRILCEPSIWTEGLELGALVPAAGRRQVREAQRVTKMPRHDSRSSRSSPPCSPSSRYSAVAAGVAERAAPEAWCSRNAIRRFVCTPGRRSRSAWPRTPPPDIHGRSRHCRSSSPCFRSSSGHPPAIGSVRRVSRCSASGGPVLAGPPCSSPTLEASRRTRQSRRSRWWCESRREHFSTSCLTSLWAPGSRQLLRVDDSFLVEGTTPPRLLGPHPGPLGPTRARCKPDRLSPCQHLSESGHQRRRGASG